MKASRAAGEQENSELHLQPHNQTIYKQQANAELNNHEMKQTRGHWALLQYRISTLVQKDNSFILLFWIGVLFVVLVAAAGGVFYLIGMESFKDNESLFPSSFGQRDPTDNDHLNAFDYFFAALVVMMDTGAMMQARSELGRAVTFLFGLVGFVMLSVILALIVEYIGAWMDKIKKGRTNVVEKDHILILGWTDVCFALVREIDLSSDSGTMASVHPLCTHCTLTVHSLYTHCTLTVHCTHYALYSLCTVLTMHCTHYALYSLCTVLRCHHGSALPRRSERAEVLIHCTHTPYTVHYTHTAYTVHYTHTLYSYTVLIHLYTIHSYTVAAA
jgi:hypothetical protein